MKPGEVRILASALGERLQEAAALKSEAVSMLERLEQNYLEPRPNVSWRHDPMAWVKAKATGRT